MPTPFCLCQCKMCRVPGSVHCHSHPNCGAPRLRPPTSPSTLAEPQVIRTLARLRADSGSHAPSVAQLDRAIPGLVQIDACFLANPYATAEVMKRLQTIPAAQLARMVAHYPSQAAVIASSLAPHIGVPAECLHLANGASEVIAALLTNSPGTLLLSLPTFSAYHEFAAGPVVTLQLQDSEDFRLNLDRLEAMVRLHSPETVVIINPNNPDGGLIPHAELVGFVHRVHSRVNQIIIDESFSHFASATPPMSLAPLVPDLPHLVVVNSLSKSHGIAGFRLGYAVMAAVRVKALQHSALWNLNAFAEWFCGLLAEPEFHTDYEHARRRYIYDTRTLFTGFDELPNVKAYPSAANFALIELDRSAAEVVGALLTQHGIYVRDCADKRGLDGRRFIRVAARTREENRSVLHGLRSVLERPPIHPIIPRFRQRELHSDRLTKARVS
jgi:histidinol-phosphate/aromatic aminotransferase/cobyric acid decarboxylase-like protein